MPSAPSLDKWSPFHATYHTTQPRLDPAQQPAAGKAAGRQGPLLASRSALVGAGALPAISGAVVGVPPPPTAYHRRKEPSEAANLHLRARVDGPDAKEWAKVNCTSSTSHEAYQRVALPRKPVPAPQTFASERISGLGWSVKGLSDTSTYVSTKERAIDGRGESVGPRNAHAAEVRQKKLEARNTTRHSPAEWTSNAQDTMGTSTKLLNELCVERVRELQLAKAAKVVRSSRPGVI